MNESAANIGQENQRQAHYALRQPSLLVALALWLICGPFNPTGVLLDAVNVARWLLEGDGNAIAFLKLPSTVAISTILFVLLRAGSLSRADIVFTVAGAFIAVVLLSPFLVLLPGLWIGEGDSYFGAVLVLYFFAALLFPLTVQAIVTVGLPSLIFVCIALFFSLRRVP